MDIKSRKLFLEAYGILRMVYGLAQIVGLTAAFFLLEFILNYPMNVSFSLFDQETLALVYLAVMLRSFFHLFAGVGIARAEAWAKMWLWGGWFVMGLITLGLSASFFVDWQTDGLVTDYGKIISSHKVFLYLCMMLFDCVFITHNISVVNENAELLQEIGGRLSVKKMMLVFFSAIVIFSILLFVGKPLKRGFHKGFYKSKGKLSEKHKNKRSLEGKKTKKPPKRKEEPLGKNKAVLDVEKMSSKTIDEDRLGNDERRVEKKKKYKKPKGLSYRALIGYFAAFCLGLGFLFQMMEMRDTKELSEFSQTGFVLLSVGFLLWIVYGIIHGKMPITIAGIFSMIGCLVICYRIIQHEQT